MLWYIVLAIGQKIYKNKAPGCALHCQAQAGVIVGDKTSLALFPLQFTANCKTIVFSCPSWLHCLMLMLLPRKYYPKLLMLSVLYREIAAVHRVNVAAYPC
jgi:hypothetical protein